MYVAGAPGTGKTLLIRRILNEIHLQSKKIRVIEFNATGMGGNAKKTSQSLLESLGYEVKLANATKMLQDILISPTEASWRRNNMIIIFIDEIDQLFSYKQETLTNLFSWAKAPLSNFLLIGAANTLDHKRFLSNLSFDEELEPTVVMFSPYSEHQLYSIMCQRLKRAGQDAEDNEIDFF